jgi:sulfoxide reductase heme-binding subunit YedZ
MNHVLWYATRATGIVALLLLTITVTLGIVGVSKLESPKWPRLVTALLHKNIALLVTAFIGIHIATTLLDSFVKISPVAAIVPFASSYRPFWLGLGAIAFDLILALIATSLLRSRMSYRAWRAVHIMAYASWPIALWHGLGTGTDAKLPWLLALDCLCLLAVAGALAWRARLLAPGRLRTTALTATVAAPIATAVFVIVGPLHSGWAVRAGTPPTVLGGQNSPTASTPGHWTKFAGHAVITTTPGSDHEVITVRASTAARGARDLTVVLAGTRDDGGIEMTAGSVRIVAVGGTPVWTGPVTSLSGSHVTAAVHQSGGAIKQVRLNLVINGHSASGRILLAPGPPAEVGTAND